MQHTNELINRARQRTSTSSTRTSGYSEITEKNEVRKESGSFSQKKKSKMKLVLQTTRSNHTVSMTSG